MDILHIDKSPSNLNSKQLSSIFRILRANEKKIEDILFDFWMEIGSNIMESKNIEEIISKIKQKVGIIYKWDKRSHIKVAKDTLINNITFILRHWWIIFQKRLRIDVILNLVNNAFKKNIFLPSWLCKSFSLLSKKEVEIFWNLTKEHLQEELKKKETREAMKTTIEWFNKNHSEIVGFSLSWKQWRDIYNSRDISVKKLTSRGIDIKGIHYRYWEYTEIYNYFQDSANQTRLLEFINIYWIGAWWISFITNENTEAKCQERWWIFQKNIVSLAKKQNMKESEILSLFTASPVKGRKGKKRG